MTTLNCHEEVELAKLVKLHPWADKVKFARSGGEANALAIRIARSACKKNKTHSNLRISRLARLVSRKFEIKECSK